MAIGLKHVRDIPHDSDGYRVLVDRLWPRGVSKSGAAIEHWLKDAAPSQSLRKSFHNRNLEWGEFRRLYLSELKNHREELRKLADMATRKRVTLVFSSRNRDRNNAVVLKEYLRRLGAP